MDPATPVPVAPIPGPPHAGAPRTGAPGDGAQDPCAQIGGSALAAIGSLHGTLLVARGLVGSGRRVDLAGLDGSAAMICAAVAMLPPEEARALRPALVALLEAVEALGTALPKP